MRIAILGATGHIAKNLIVHLQQNPNHELILFARNLNVVKMFLKAEKINVECQEVSTFNTFSDNKYDVIINCIGIGDPSKLREAGNGIFTLTEYYDNLILEYMQQNTEVMYINLSSGAAYGSDFTIPVDESSNASIPINDISPTNYYSVAKLYSEAKHRACAHLNIIDLRVFGFFSRFIDLRTPYLINDIINCVKSKRTLITYPDDIVRDYVHPQDLAQLVELCITTENVNDVFDIYSLSPVKKFEIIDYFVRRHHLEILIQEPVIHSATGQKSNYFTRSKRASKIGYNPLFTSLESIVTQSERLLEEVSDSQ